MSLRRGHREKEGVSSTPTSSDETCPRTQRYEQYSRHRIVLLTVIAAAVMTVCVKLQQSTPRVALEEASRPNNRFPKYGTAEFTQQCNWAMQTPKELDCTILQSPRRNLNEGIANWLALATSGFIYSKLVGCRFLMEYSADVDLHQIIVPHDDGSVNNWTVPTNFPECTNATKCTLAFYTAQLNRRKPKPHEPPKLPNYRHAVKDSPLFNMYRKNLQHLSTSLLGFELETAMACTFESLIQLSPSASRFEPDLFTRILPTLQDESTLVLSVYLRTDQTDWVANAEKEGKSAREQTEQGMRAFLDNYVSCILNVEREHLSVPSSYTRVAWMVVSDSPVLKQMIATAYTTENVNTNDAAVAVPREIVTTTTRGIHTRATRNPSTADFAEGMIDWYLIGESDVVLSNKANFYTFGTTGALRTARPIYDSGTCTKLTPFVKEYDPPWFEDEWGKGKANEPKQQVSAPLNPRAVVISV